jgi:hypothetical protein
MPAPKPKRVGRPPLPKGNAKAVMLRVRISTSDLRAIETAARVNKQTVSGWIRSTIHANLEG